jgi:hypothetical protein
MSSTGRGSTIMNRIIEANFLPPPVEETEEKPRILLIDDSPDFTYSQTRSDPALCDKLY